MNKKFSDLFPEFTEEFDIHLQEVSRKIFVNRNLRMKKVKMIGFDMDYTLAPYKKKEIETLQYDLVKKRLVETMGFPKEIAEYNYINDFVVLGLSIDLNKGNIIKVDRYNFVTRAYHGTKQLPEEQLFELYRNKTTPLNLYDNFVRVDTLFSLPESCLFSQIVDNYSENSFYATYKELYEKIRVATDSIHRDDSLKGIIKNNISKYIEKDLDLPLTLNNFKTAGKKLFILTNSYFDYTNAVMSYLLDGALSEYENWTSYFDLIIVGSRKPDFFVDGNELLKLNIKGEIITDPEFKTNIYQGGHIEDLERITELKGENVLYIGDHIYGDILKVKKTSMWRTCLIVEDLEKEMKINEKNRDLTESLANYDYKINILESELNYQEMIAKSLKKTIESSQRIISSLEKKVFTDLIDKSQQRTKKINNVLNEVLREYDILRRTVEKQYNKYWGMIFKENREKTKFAAQLEDFACLYTSRVTNFLFYSPSQYFRSPMDVMAHELF